MSQVRKRPDSAFDSLDDDDDDDELVDETHLVTFRIDKEEYGVCIMQVQEIIRTGDIQRVPHSLPAVEGIMDLRGKVLPVLDLRKQLGLPVVEGRDRSRIIVVNVAGQTLGLTVDAISEVLRLPNSAIEPPPPIIAGVDARHLLGIGRVQSRLLILLDLDKVLSAQELLGVSRAASG